MQPRPESYHLKEFIQKSTQNHLIILPGQAETLAQTGFTIQDNWRIRIPEDMSHTFLAIPYVHIIELFQNNEIARINNLAEATLDSLRQVTAVSNAPFQNGVLQDYSDAVLHGSIEEAMTFYPTANIIPGILGLGMAFAQQNIFAPASWGQIHAELMPYQNMLPNWVNDVAAMNSRLLARLQTQQ